MRGYELEKVLCADGKRRWMQMPTDPEERKKSVAHRVAGGMFAALKVKRMRCECLSTKITFMHHPDYDQPWLVAFLCGRCHALEHNGKLQRAYRIHDLRKGIDP